MRTEYVNEFLDADEKQKEVLVLCFLLDELLDRIENKKYYGINGRNHYYLCRSYDYINRKIKEVA
tara:strand:- start:80 stop:274 length:195 start_codon:yes stop_codon:yes gene_type:complete